MRTDPTREARRILRTRPVPVADPAFAPVATDKGPSRPTRNR